MLRHRRCFGNDDAKELENFVSKFFIQKKKCSKRKKKIRNKLFLSNIRKIQLFSKHLLSKYNPNFKVRLVLKMNRHFCFSLGFYAGVYGIYSLTFESIWLPYLFAELNDHRPFIFFSHGKFIN